MEINQGTKSNSELLTYSTQIETMVDFIWRNIPGIEAFFLIDKYGNIKFTKSSNKFEQEFFSQIDKFISGTLSQFQNMNSNSHQNRLNLMVNVFQSNTILAYPINGENLVLLAVPNGTSYSDSVNFVMNLQNFT